MALPELIGPPAGLILAVALLACRAKRRKTFGFLHGDPDTLQGFLCTSAVGIGCLSVGFMVWLWGGMNPAYSNSWGRYSLFLLLSLGSLLCLLAGFLLLQMIVGWFLKRRSQGLSRN